MEKRFEIQVAQEHSKKRLDDFLFGQFPTLGKMYLRGLIRDEKCEVNGEWKNRGYRVRGNDFIEIVIDLARPTSTNPEQIPLDIVYEDSELLVINKPSGMLVHPTIKKRTNTLLNAVSYYLNQNEKLNENDSGLSLFDSHEYTRAGLIHRLDKNTSGLILVSKNARALRILSEHFHRKIVEKRYLALVEGLIKEDFGTIEAPIGRYIESRFWDVKADGRNAVTNFWVRERRENSTLLELEPVTGRTNQLRIHLAHLDHPIVGDDKYFGREYHRLCLHAWKIKFWHPDGGRKMEFETTFEAFTD